jgi:maltose/maltodextrin transport system substrate-binding protein/arabinogalactan oligomer/maltooligosaccharide transport system substrate-binding protein
MKGKWFSWISLLLVVSILLTACGATPEPTAAPEPTKAAAPTEPPEPTGEPATADVQYDLVVLPGTFQTQLGCEADWAPDCEATALAYDEASGTWMGTFDIAAGAYEYKVAINGAWDISYPEGMNNLALSLAVDAPVTFTFNPDSKEITAESEGLGEAPGAESVDYDMVVLAGTMQAQLGCDADWTPDCEATALTYDEASGTWVGTFDITAGSYDYKVAMNGGWDITYPEGMAGQTLELAEDAPVTFTFDPAASELVAESEGLGEAPAGEAVAYEAVVVAGTLQAQLGCDADWMPDCEATALTFDEASGTWTGTFDVAAGAYDYKVAMNNAWDITVPEGMNALTLELAEDAPVTFVFDPATNELTAESEGAAESPAAAEEGGLVIWADMLVGPTLEELVVKFEEEYGIPITVESMGYGVVINTFNVAAPAGEGPDIIVATHNMLGEFVTGGLISPVDLGDKEADFYPATIQALRYGGELYGMPIATDNVAFIRNTEMVPEAPNTWDEVVEISRELTASNDDDIETNQYGFLFQPGDSYHFFPIQNAFGGYIFGQNEDGSWNTDDVGLDSPGSIASVEWLGQLLDEGLQPRGIDGPSLIDWFEAGRFGMGITGPWFLDRLRESGIPFEFSDLPAAEKPGQPFLGVGSFMVSAFSKEPLLAQIFLTEFVATEEIFGGLYDGEQRVYAYMPLMENIDDPDLAAIAHAGINGLPVPAIPEMNAVWSSWNGALTLIDQGADTPEAAFSTAADQIRTALEE